MVLCKKIEKKLILFVKKIFSSDEWDFLHTLSCVHCMKKIISSVGGNARILIPAMYLHDIGYAGSLQKKYSLDDRLGAKLHHMERGIIKAKGILEELHFAENEVNKILHLISVHDKLDELKTRDEFLVAEADSLGAIDPEVPQNNFGEDEYARYVGIFKKKRVPLIRTNVGKELFAEFVSKNELFKKYYEK
jgi:hypothetical protein